MQWNYIFSGLFILLLGSYLDNVRGPLLPVLTQELAIPYSQTSVFLAAGTIGSILCLLKLNSLSRTHSPRAITLLTCVLIVLAALLAPFVDSFVTLFILAIVLGAAIAAVGGICNILIYQGTDLKNRGRFLCALHSMYALGSLVAPPTLAAVVGGGLSWRWSLTLMALPAIFLAVFAKCKLPRDIPPPSGPQAGFRLRGTYILLICVFTIYVCGEVLISMWMSTYLMESLRLPLSEASSYLSGFFIFMGLSRLLCFFSLRPQLETFALIACLLISMASFLLGHAGWWWGFSLSGLIGPFFPLVLARISRHFPEDAKALTLTILLSVHSALAISHLFLGRLIDTLGISLAYYLPAALILVTLIGLILYLRQEKQAVRYGLPFI